MLIKILEKQQKVKTFLSKFNQSKVKDVFKMKMVEREQKFKVYTTEEINNNEDVQKEYYSGNPRLTPTFKYEATFDNNILNNAVDNLKDSISTRHKTKEVNDIIEQIKK